MADRDQAVKNVIHSAFSNCGQKCSATSLLILEKEIYNDKNFKNKLVDAARSYAVGSAWNFKNKMGPLIQPPAGKLKKALTRLNKGEEWALQPESKPDNPFLWSPGIKWGVSPGSDTHITEFFGPLLGVMCAKNLDEAVDIANQTGYGLTSGLESLDSEEQEFWKKNIKAGNLYINRSTTGAVVLRQPFGGMGKSSIGAGIKAGGPNYAAQFMDTKDLSAPLTGAIKEEHPLMHLTAFLHRKSAWGELQNHKTDLCKLFSAVKSYIYAKENEFSVTKDYFHLRGQDNLFIYIPAGKMVVRLHAGDTLFEILARIAAAKISGCGLIISIPKDLKNEALEFLFSRDGEKFSAGAEILHQSNSDLIKMLPGIAGIRYAAPDRAPADLLKTAARRGFYISTTNVVMEGRIELVQYHMEQSICCNYHRYGNLGDRRRTE
jgi:RHH-type proline utilization regulon transcriptional repressor/proline dehydrogenase/delta 1-pyrroline-5-carboxylate dehydrogenase